MEINILDIDKEITENGWLEVKAPRYFTPNTSENDPDGLISNEIFGSPGTEDRKKRWGWINLHCCVMMPHIYYVFKSLKSTIADDMKNGIGRYYVDKNGDLVKLNNEETLPKDALSDVGYGFVWLRSVWDKLSWKVTKGMTNTAAVRRKFLKSVTVSEAFTTKFLVMPAFYRDVDYRKQKRSETNVFYMQLLHAAEMAKNTDDFTMLDDNTDEPKSSQASIKIMDMLMEMYTTWVCKMGSANGFVNDYVAGKATDYGARLVISTPDYNTERYTDIEADFFHSSVPLAVAVNIFVPFIINGLIEWVNNLVAGKRSISYFDKLKGEFVNKELNVSYMEDFTSEQIVKKLDLYKKSKEFRVEKVTLKAEDGSKIPVQYLFHLPDDKTEVHISIDNLEDNAKELATDLGKHIRDMTWCELLYIIAYQKLNDKCIYNTRYPVADYNGTYAGKMNIIPSNKYTPIYVDGVYYPRFPIVTAKNTYEKEHMFTDTMRMFSVYPSALGADFDGDQISTQSVFTEDAKEDCEKYMKSLVNVIGVNGNIIREFPAVTRAGIYGLTYKVPKPTK